MNIDLEKRVHKVTVELAKHNILKAPVLRVGLALDISGSARGLYDNGTIQKVVDRLLALAMKFDDDGSMDMWAFSNGFSRLNPATADVFQGYVHREIMNNGDIDKWRGTNYAPVMNDILDMYFREPAGAVAQVKSFFGKLFGKKQAATAAPAVDASQIPALNLFVTDGANDDRSDTENLLRLAASDHKVYWQMVGVGSPHQFGFIKQMADELPNVGFVNLSSLNISEDSLYAEIITKELCQWVGAQ